MRDSISTSTARSKPASLSAANWAQVIEAVAGFERGEVDEVACLGLAEQREELVNGQLFDGQCRTDRARLGGQQPVVDAQVDLGVIVAVADRHSGEAVCHLPTLDRKMVCTERCFQSREQPIDGIGVANEEVEIVSLAIDRAADNQRAAASERESLGFGKIGENEGDALLQRAQHVRLMPRWRRNQSDQATRTRAGTTIVSHSFSSTSTSMNWRTSSSVPSRRTCSYTRARSAGSSRS